MWGCRVDKKLKEDRKENLRQFGCWGLQVDPKVIEARKAKLSASMRKFWDDPVLGPGRRLAASKAMIAWWDDPKLGPGRKLAASEAMSAWWNDPVLGPGRKLAASEAMSAYWNDPVLGPGRKLAASEAASKAMSAWWDDPVLGPGRRLAAMEASSSWWNDPELGPAHRLAAIEAGSAWWNDPVLGLDRKKAKSKIFAAKREEVDQVYIVEGTVCPRCNTALDRDSLASVSVQASLHVTYRCPCKVQGKKCGVRYIGDAHVRAEIYKSSKDLSDDQKTSMEDNIKAWMVREVDQFNAAGKAAADEAAADFRLFEISARMLTDMGPKGASQQSLARKKRKREQMAEASGGG